MIILFLACVQPNPSILKHFLNNQVRIFVSSAQHVFLGIDTETGTVEAMSRYLERKTYNGKFIIEEGLGHSYAIKNGSDHICRKNGELKTCSDTTPWNLELGRLGWMISSGMECVTVYKNRRIVLEPCGERREQMFGLRPVDHDGDGCTKTRLVNKDRQDEIVLNIPG